MTGAKLLSGLLCLALAVQYGITVNAAADDGGVIIRGNMLYSESFDEQTSFANNADYSITSDGERGVLLANGTGKVGDMQSLAGVTAADVITDFNVRLASATGATNNSLFFTMRAAEPGGAGIKFAYHDITKYNSETGSFGNARTRDRISVAYSGGSGDMTAWNIATMSGTLGIENTSGRCFSDYYTFNTAVVGDMAYYRVLSEGGSVVGSLEADISGYSAPESGRMYIGAHNCSAYIDDIRMYEAISAAELSIEAENMELNEGETTSFNIRVLDTNGKWHLLDKELNSSFDFDYDSDKLSVDVENGTITAYASDGLSISITGYDFYSGKAKTDEFVFESVSDEAAVESAKEALELDIDYAESDFKLPVEGLYKTSIAWESSDPAIRVISGKAKVFLQSEERVVTLTATISRESASVQKAFDVTVPGVEMPDRDVILKGALIYSEDFDDAASMDTPFVNAIDNQKIKHEDGALHIDSKGVVYTGPVFGPVTEDCIAEYDAMQLGCSANSNAQFSIGLMTNGSASYRFAYSDVSMYNTAANDLTGSQSRDRIFLGRTASSSNMGEWMLYGTGKSPIGILNRTQRGFDKYYTFNAAAAGNTLLFSVTDGSNVLDSVSYYDGSLKLGSGNVSLNMQSTELMLDNIKVYKAVGIKDMQLTTDKAVLTPGEPMGFKIILSDGSVLNKEFYDLIEFSCETGIEVDKERSEITADSEGSFSVSITARDYAEESVSITKSAFISASASADAIEKLTEEFDISDYLDYPNGIISDFVLPDKFGGAELKWRSDNDAIKINGLNALVNRGEENTEVTLTVNIAMNGISVEKQFNVTVEKDYSSAESIAMDKNMLSIPERTKENIELPVSGRYGSHITWSSGNGRVISNTGIVKRGIKDTMVKLTAVFEVGGSKETQYYNVVVIGTESGSSSGGGGGGGSSGSGSGSASGGRTVEVPLPVNAPEKSSEFEFEDVSSDFWAAQSIYDMVRRDIISKDTRFRPEDSITREEFVKLVVEAFGLYSSTAETDFDDVGRDAWYYGYVASAVRSGIVQGLDGSLFGSGKNITRQDIAVIIERILRNHGAELADSGIMFSDSVDIADYAVNAVAALAKEGIITGMDNNTFAPADNATRAQAAVMIYRAYSMYY